MRVASERFGVKECGGRVEATVGENPKRCGRKKQRVRMSLQVAGFA
jgi:hypothetical protein